MALTPEALARLTKLHLLTQRVVDGLISGLHRSRSRGQSVEFAEHKEYAPGDELRHIDWKAYGKLDRYYVKRFDQETNLGATLVVDASASMAYGSPTSKYELAALLANALATVLVRQQDLVGLALWHAGRLHHLPPHASPAHLAAFAAELAGTVPSGTTELGALADGLAEKLRRRSLVIVLSDLFDTAANGLARLTALRARGHDLAILQILDQAELTFPFEDPTLFLSMEDARRLEANPRDLRQGYLVELRRFLADTARHCQEHDCDYQLVSTAEPPEKVLTELLGRRARRRGGAAA